MTTIFAHSNSTVHRGSGGAYRYPLVNASTSVRPSNGVALDADDGEMPQWGKVLLVSLARYQIEFKTLAG